MKTLILPVKKKWFDKIKAGNKLYEYRLYNDNWQNRLIGKTLDKIVITWGYPKTTDTERRIFFLWSVYVIKTITSEEWINIPQAVFAIKLK